MAANRVVESLSDLLDRSSGGQNQPQTLSADLLQNHPVNAPNPSDGQSLIWNAASGAWIASTITGQPGHQGPPGPQGPMGLTGNTGVPGPAGLPGYGSGSFLTVAPLSYEPTSGTISLDPSAILSPTGNGAQLTSLNASALASGTVAFARLPVGSAASTVAAGNDSRIVNALSITGNASSTTVIPAGASLSRTLAAKFADTVNVLDFGADNTGATDSAAAIASAVAVAKAGKKRVYLPAGIYRLNATLDCRSTLSGGYPQIDFAGFIGDGPEKTCLLFYGNNSPIIRVTGPYYQIEKLSIGYATQQTISQTSSNCIQFEDQCAFCAVRDCFIYGGYCGIKNVVGGGVTAQTLFNVSFDNLRFRNHAYAAISLYGGTGSSFNNIYCSNQGITSVYRMIELITVSECAFNQVNTEQSNVRDCVLALMNCDNPVINAWHIEGVQLYSQGTNGAESYSAAFLNTSTFGTVMINGMEVIQFSVGPVWLSSITRSGTSATATVKNLGLQVTSVGGHGFSIGDTVTIAGASDALYNGTFTVTGTTLTTFTYTLASTPAADATPAVGNDYIAATLGGTNLNATGAITLFSGVGRARNIVVNGLRVSYGFRTGISQSSRSGLFRVVNDGTANLLNVQINSCSFEHLTANANFLSDMPIVGAARSSNIVTVYTLLPHYRLAGDTVLIRGMSGVSNDVKSIVSVIDPYTFTINQTGSDVGLTAQSGASLALATARVSLRARASNVATLTTAAAHGFNVGQEIYVNFSNGTGYSTTNAAILSIPSSTSLTYYNIGADESTIADGAIIMLLPHGISPSSYTALATSTALTAWKGFYQGQACLNLGTIASGAVATSDLTLYGARVGDTIRFSPMSLLTSPLLLSAAVLTNNSIRFQAMNPTSGSITPPTFLLRFKLTR